MMFKRIDHVEIVTDQLDRTVHFYTEVLGFTVKALDRIERSGLGVPIDLVYLDLGGTVVELIATMTHTSTQLRGPSISGTAWSRSKSTTCRRRPTI
jgi:catechol 2,3-dioxygenase-like lactoylglutathione lyase family enzyme